MVFEETVGLAPYHAPIFWFSDSPNFVSKYGLEIHNTIQEVCSPMVLKDDHLRRIMKLMLASMEEGLSKEKSATAAVKMLPSYVRSVPNGTERGNFLALDLGGTNFRVLLIRLEGKEADMSSKIYRIPHELMIGTGEALFDHIAHCLKTFMEDEGLKGIKLPLGFTFSFPCRQQGLTKGSLINWTKGFKASGVEGQDIVILLRDACRRIAVDIDVVALLNDTTGTLMACAHKENTCQVGVIVGTGTNACYMEKIVKCAKLDGEIDVKEDEGPDEIIINTEWGAFGDDGNLKSILTEFDVDVDTNSINPGKQLFEKMISGMYMGELVRLVLANLCDKQLMFQGQGSDTLYKRGSFPTKYVSEIESDLLDEDRTFSNTMQILDDIGVEHSPADCANVAYVCSVVSQRAAHLCAVGIAVLLNRMQKPMCTVGVDGSVYRFHPTFKQILEDKITDLVDSSLKFQLMLSEDGSGKGAALVAAVACRVEEERAKKKANKKL